MACDGVWDVLTSAEGTQYVREVLEERKSGGSSSTVGSADDGGSGASKAS